VLYKFAFFTLLYFTSGDVITRRCHCLYARYVNEKILAIGYFVFSKFDQFIYVCIYIYIVHNFHHDTTEN